LAVYVIPSPIQFCLYATFWLRAEIGASVSSNARELLDQAISKNDVIAFLEGLREKKKSSLHEQ
jgi:hypothetical protein